MVDWKYGRFMVLEIPADEFKYNQIHRYSVIPHEYFHAFQMSHYQKIFMIVNLKSNGYQKERLQQLSHYILNNIII